MIRTDGALLYESDPTSTSQTPVLDAGTGLPLTGMSSVQEGAYHGCAVQDSTHTAWCWRISAYGNAYGQLGNGTIDSLTTAFQATQVLTAANTPMTNVARMADAEAQGPSGNSAASCAVRTDGTLYCWGTLTYLKNNGSALTSSYAVPITTDGVTPLTGVIRAGVFGAGVYACAITQGTSAKQVWCWGRNTDGYLGLGDTTARQYPTQVLGIDDPIEILAGDYFGGSTCVLDGSQVRCWGYNARGEVGNGTTNTPVRSPSLVTLMNGTTALGNVAALHTGDYGELANFCALSTSSTLLCWGYNYLPYPADYGVANVALLGGTGTYVRYVTSDGLYHHGTISNHVGTTRTPNCGPLH